MRWSKWMGRASFTLALVLISLSRAVRAESNWPAWGGPDGSNHAQAGDLPLKWSKQSIAWKTPLTGVGQSTPVVWGDRIFLTTAPDKGQKRVVLCADRQTGKILWEQTAWTGTPEETHRMNGWASATCATDGDVVVAFFGRGGLHAYRTSGEHLWSRDLGPFDGPWGTAASPRIVGDLVIQNCDSESPAALLAVDKNNGKTVWKTDRESMRGWSTPLLVEADGRQQLVLNGNSGVRAYDAKSGKELWFCKSVSGRGEPVPALSAGMLYVVNGLPGEMYAVRTGGSGDVTDTHMVWHTPRRQGRDLPSPMVVRDYLLVLGMNGILNCYQTQTGKELWTERIGPAYACSPLEAGGHVYLQSETGETTVIEPGEQLKTIAQNTLGAESDEIFRAGLCPSDGQFFTRSDRYLYCIGAGETASRKSP